MSKNGGTYTAPDGLISVIIPIYNVEKYLQRCIDSVINQDYGNLEIILVDDGSQDNSPKICDEFAAVDRRIAVIHKSNGGLSSARNIGIAAATGTYIILVDADDYIDPHMAGYLLSMIDKENTDLAICSFQYVDEEGNKTREDLQAYCPLKKGILGRDELLGLINTNSRGYWFYSVPFNKLYKSSILKKLKYPEQYIFEDEFMIHHLLGNIESASITDECLYMYTQRSESITAVNGYDSLRKMDFIYALEDRYVFFKSRGYDKYAYDTADLLNCVFIKISRSAFRQGSDYFHYLWLMFKISLIQISEFKKSGIKLPLVYFKGLLDIALFRRSNA